MTENIADTTRSRRLGHIARAACHIVALILLLPAAAAADESSFIAFESGQVRPMAISADRSRLFVANTPDNRLEVFAILGASLVHLNSIPVGLEPVAVAVRNDAEVWVVNHLSDSVSVVRLAPSPRVVRTLKVGDEPRDIVFAGPNNGRAFISAANRRVTLEQISPEKKNGGADVWVFEADNPGDNLFGTPLTVVNLFSDVPRGLAVSPDGETVYVAALHSGNQTAVVSADDVELAELLPPFQNVEGETAPRQGLIVKWDGSSWRDTVGRDWSDTVPVFLPDLDVFAIDAMAPVPDEVAGFAHVGTTLFNIAVNPVSGKLYVSNQEALNHIRFEGPGDLGGSTVRGRFVDNRITVIDGDMVLPRDLNKHIDYSRFPGTPQENARSLATPLEMAVSSDGETLYVAAFGSGKIGVFSTASLEDDSFVPAESDHIEVSGGGPSGLVLNETRNLLYILKRFTNRIGIVNTVTMQEIADVRMHTPEPAHVVNGRRFLYDARYTSSRGNSSCAGCHIFGDTDHLAWDLGDPDGLVVNNPNPIRVDLLSGVADLDFHPMKGPMTTQSLRGMANHGPLHWRGDRTGGNEPEADPFDVKASFRTFGVAFEGLVGRASPLLDAEMNAFTDFALALTYPPNPIRNMDNSLTPAQARGEDFYRNFPTARFPTTGQFLACNDCHVVDVVAGHFGTDGFSSAARPGGFGGGNAVKIPHLRNVYTKLGNLETAVVATGAQYRGFFLNHQGSTGTLFNFLRTGDFDFPGGDLQRKDVLEFILAVDTNLAPVVGHQATIRSDNQLEAIGFIKKLEGRAAVTDPRPECDLIVKGLWGSQHRGWLRQSNGLYTSDRAAERPLRLQGLLSRVGLGNQELTFTCVPPGSGVRMGLDQDGDGAFDRDELDAGTDPTNPFSVPGETNLPGVRNPR